ncbi:hypothetical protein SAMN04489719_0094 [Agrococcus carbonis]|uniref:Uncharacterized protein n=1 Tax=Agrococcus carbonis TaxID=684552 RepID=A0A1H1KTG8_9MICO|nr:hypothetical protein SAMN04489719_0094 [Agrococcus carbonis]
MRGGRRGGEQARRGAAVWQVPGHGCGAERAAEGGVHRHPGARRGGVGRQAPRPLVRKDLPRRACHGAAGVLARASRGIRAAAATVAGARGRVRARRARAAGPVEARPVLDGRDRLGDRPRAPGARRRACDAHRGRSTRDVGSRRIARARSRCPLGAARRDVHRARARHGRRRDRGSCRELSEPQVARTAGDARGARRRRAALGALRRSGSAARGAAPHPAGCRVAQGDRHAAEHRRRRDAGAEVQARIHDPVTGRFLGRCDLLHRDARVVEE